ncbi:CDP-diacylglycerol pyrophosphatase [Caballeronia telluris]|uniref:CDP-diacylglycerol pyrophosphatase n=2 Tax=Caballeronia telluris TaxID=326475 RepID=A0A158IN50_9BURK|nr:CDP-diacylglycerol pyrophosphatase [Caballeronia telluris]SAL58511.1 CDP-diacylglycerol pyrophosphatase [Caballeronia telluris]
MQVAMIKRSTSLAALFVSIALACAAPCARAHNPNALWEIVHDSCVPAAEGADIAQKCIDVNLAGGYAVLKDIVGVAQYLLIPTTRIGGIESADLLVPGTPNYFRAAWQARRFVDEALDRDMPRDTLSLAINSAYGRTQNQLHIHIDCLAPDVVAALREYGPRAGTDWSPFPVLLRGHAYRIRRIDDADLARTDPFKLLAPDVAREGQVMAEQTLLLAGATLRDGTPAFYLLNDHVKPGDWASSEELQDHSCAVAKERGRSDKK